MKKKKKKWCKEIGHFKFMNVNLTSLNAFSINVFFKDELIGILETKHILDEIHKKSSYDYDLDIFNKHSSFFNSTLIGRVKCSGIKHHLPKTIKSVTLNLNCQTLISKRRVLTEKHPFTQLKLIFSPSSTGIPLKLFAV